MRVTVHQIFCVTALVALTLTAAVNGAGLRINVGGPTLPSIDFYNDFPKYLTKTSNNAVFSLSSPVKGNGEWNQVYSTYRYAFSGNLEYKFPVLPGKYKVSLMFAETYGPTQSKGARKFGIFINGVKKRSALDVFSLVGANKPLYISFPGIAAPSGFITISLTRIPGAENPMLSGLVIAGVNPGAIIKPGGSNSGTPDPKCKNGIFAKNTQTGQMACCEKACGKCGGSKCGTLKPGKLCCISSIHDTAPSCNVASAPCVPASNPGNSTPDNVPSPCKAGIYGFIKGTIFKACCPKECGQCGGASCNTAAPGKICCIKPISRLQKSCDSNPPPCVPSVKVGGVSPVPSPSKIQMPKPSPVSGGKCPISGATSKSFRMNLAGGVVPGANMGADNDGYITSENKGDVFSSPTTKISAPAGPQPWDDAYSSHRFTLGSILTYSIPVPSGKYTVKLLFAETYFGESKQRVFDVFINGVEKVTGLDVFARVGKNKGLLLSYPGLPSVGGLITISVSKVIENPMISGIMIEGKGAGDLAKGGGCSGGGSAGGGNGGGNGGGSGGGNSNGGFNHRAHSVPGGPYVGTDFEKKGYAVISLDGTSSHSHYSDPGPPPVYGKIVSYKWTWTVTVSGKKVTKVNTNKSGKFTAQFPLGVTVVSLEVADQTGDVAVDSTTVQVKSSTENGAYCYFYNFNDKILKTIPIALKLDSDPRPQFGDPYASINFNGPASLSKVPFKSNALAIRCVFFLHIKQGGTFSYSVEHNGPFKLYDGANVISQSTSSGKTSSPPKTFALGLHSFQLHYFRPKSLPVKLILKQNGNIIPPSVLQHDSSTTLPVIEKLSSATSAPSGGGNIQIYGSGFVNGVSVKFGKIEAPNLISSDAGTVQVSVPPGKGKVLITVSTNAGTSNAFPFEYTSSTTLDQPVIFEKKLLTNKNGNKYSLAFAVDVKFGPDGRLYVSTVKGELHALSVDKNFKVSTSCVRKFSTSEALLGIAFNPASTSLKMYFTVSVLYWKEYDVLSFEEGWPNGKIKSIVWSSEHLVDGGGNSCAGNVETVVTGLPVSNHDHGINKLEFLPNGQLLISVGGFTNGGKSVPGRKPVPGDPPSDSLGGVASNPLSASYLVCPTNKVTNVKYSQYTNPVNAQVVSGKECTIYATGFRNSFGMTVHSNGNVYLTDNGPNANFGDFTKDCNGNTGPAGNYPDRLYRLHKGKWHGHPNLNRKECVHYIYDPPSAIKPILSSLQSSMPAIIEYRSNTFGGALKGSLILSQFAGTNEGVMAQVVLSNDGDGYTSFVPNFFWASGLAIAEGPAGQIVAGRVYKGEIMVVTPKFPKPGVTFLLGVMPRRGPASGGAKVLISGFNFGKSPSATFGGAACKNVKVIDDEQFTCITPGNKKGVQVPVIVTGSSGKSPSYGNDYWYW